MPDNQFKEFMSKVYGDMYINMYKNMYGQLYNNIKSEILASLSDKQSTKMQKLKIIKILKKHN